MTSLLLISLLTRSVEVPLPAQSWKIGIGIEGHVNIPSGGLDSPQFDGTFEYKPVPEKKGLYTKMSLRRWTGNTVDTLIKLTGLKESEAKSPTLGLWADKNWLYAGATGIFGEDKKPLISIESEEVDAIDWMLPFQMAVGVGQLAMNDPSKDVKRLLAVNGDKQFFASLKPDIYSTADAKKGDFAYTYSISLVQGDKSYPKYADGTVLVNRKTHKVKLLTAVVAMMNTPPTIPEDRLLDYDTIAVRLTAQ